jgi:hypothetical protein
VAPFKRNTLFDHPYMIHRMAAHRVFLSPAIARYHRVQVTDSRLIGMAVAAGADASDPVELPVAPPMELDGMFKTRALRYATTLSNTSIVGHGGSALVCFFFSDAESSTVRIVVPGHVRLPPTRTR